jgi:hypothetical protein
MAGAIINVDADLMEMTYQEGEHGMFRPLLILLTDTGGVHLVTPSGSTTKSYETVLMRNQATKPSHAKHIQHWYGWWARVTIDNEKLTAHGACLQKQIKRKTHCIKTGSWDPSSMQNVHRQDQRRN